MEQIIYLVDFQGKTADFVGSMQDSRYRKRTSV